MWIRGERLIDAIRRVLFTLWVAAVRLGRRRERIALVGIGVGLGAAMLAVLLAGSLTGRDRAIERRLRALPPAERTLRAAWFGIPDRADFEGTLDPLARDALRSISPNAPIRAMLYRQTRVEGRLFDLGAIEGLRSWVRLRSGRLPRPCTSRRCEVVQVGGSGAVPSVPGLRLVLVGRGRLTSKLPLGRTAPPGAYGSVVETARFRRSQTNPPFLLAEGVAGLTALPELQSIFRSYGWVVPVASGSVHPWEIVSFAAAVTRARASLQSSSIGFDLTAPTVELEAAQISGRLAGRRLFLLGGQAAALVLAFAVLAAGVWRRDARAGQRRLLWSGARRWQLSLASVAETGAIVVAAVGLGWLLGVALSAGLASRVGSPALPVLRHSVLSAVGLLAAVSFAVVAALVLLVGIAARPIRVGELSLNVLDMAALGALAVIAVGLARGEANPQALANERGTGMFLMVLPGLVTLVAAIVVARLLPPALRLLERPSRTAPFAARLAIVSLARAPGRASIVVGFLAVSLGLAAFAATYRSTLEQGQVDQAAFAVPLDFILAEDLTKLVRPIDAAPLSGYRALGPDIEVRRVIRLSASVSRFGDNRGVTLIGVPVGSLPRLRGWRADFADRPIAELARRIRPVGRANLRGPRLPLEARTVEIPIALRGDDIVITLDIETPRGDFAQLALGETRGLGVYALRGRIPRDARGGRIVGMSLEPTALSRETGEPLQGTLGLGPLRVRGPDGGAIVSYYSGWIGVNGISVDRAGGKTRLRYLVTQQLASRFQPRHPTHGRPVPVVASDALAAAAGPGGVLPVRVVGQQINLRIVAAARRFPSTEGDFALADELLLHTALNAESPGSGLVNEFWVGAPTDARAAEMEAALKRPPFDALELRSRRAIEKDLRGDPLARAVLLALTAVAGVALVLSLGGLVLAVVADLRDEEGELFDLEAEGAPPAAIRRHVALRALALTACGVVGGAVTALALVATVLALVALTANAALPEPPLLLDVDWVFLAFALLAYVVIAAVAVATLARRAFRASEAGRPRGV